MDSLVRAQCPEGSFLLDFMNAVKVLDSHVWHEKKARCLASLVSVRDQAYECSQEGCSSPLPLERVEKTREATMTGGQGMASD